MSDYEFRELVAKMRSAQRDYFRTRSRDALDQSKQLERAVDAAISGALKDNQTTLF